MARKVYDNEILQGVKLIFRNFRGLERKNTKGKTMNAAGKRNFNIQLNSEQYEDLRDKGWSVRTWEDADGATLYLLKVNLGWNDSGRGPLVKLTPTDGSKVVILDEDTIGILDTQEVESADVVIRPYNWDSTGENGASAWLKSMKAYVYVDPIESEIMSEMEESDSEELPFD
jgi:hypothetical protein